MSRMNLTDNLESSKQKGLSASQFHKPRHILDLEAIHQPHKPSIEIVFVHGLGGESRGTWTDGQDSVCNFWPAWLPTVPGLENARILCFGYDSDWKKLWKPQTTLGIPQFGTSLLGALQLDNEKEAPIIFIAHSMGGLVVKRAIIEANLRHEPGISKISERIKGIIFIATPHRGADYAVMLNLLLERVFGESPSVEQLRPSSLVLESITDDFQDIAKSLELVSFYESTEYLKQTGPIVPRSSAKLEYSLAHNDYLNGNHLEITKYRSVEDANYQKVSKWIKTIADRILASRGPMKTNNLKLIDNHGKSQVQSLIHTPEQCTQLSSYQTDIPGWQSTWVPINGHFPPKAVVTAVTRTDRNIDVFICGSDSQVYTAWLREREFYGINGHWKSLSGSFPPGNEIAAVARWENALNLVAAGPNGNIYTAWWPTSANGHGWSGSGGWMSLGGSNLFPPGASVSVISRIKVVFDVFVCGVDRCVYNIWGLPEQGTWNHWISLGGGPFTPGAKVTAVVRKWNRMDLFVCGSDGQIYTSWWQQGDGWSGLQGWKSLGGTFPPKAEVAAVSCDENHLDIFVCAQDKRVYTVGWTNGMWGTEWKAIGGLFPPGARITAVTRGANKIALFICGFNGNVYTSWRRDTEWTGTDKHWLSLGGSFPPGGKVEGLHRGPDILDIFSCNSDGRVWTLRWRNKVK